MNPVVFALRHPVTIVVAVVGLVLGAGLALWRMPVDIFPRLNLPVIYVCQPYGGMDPAQMEGLLTNYYEYHFLYINGIDHVESKNVQGVALMKLYFQPNTDMAQAMAETINYVNRSRAFMPPGTVPPFVMRFDTGSVPVGYLVFSSDNPERTIGQIQDQALFRVRPIFATLPGVSAPPPFGGNARTVVVNVDPDRLSSYQLSPDDVVQALSQGNAISPSGNIRIGDQMPIVPTNAMVLQPKELGDIVIRQTPAATDGRVGHAVYVRDVLAGRGIEDATDIPTGYALVNGKRAVYILVTKRADASTLAVVNVVKANMDRMQKALDPDINVRFEFDQSPYVTRAMTSVGVEAALGAVLTGLMVLLFLRDWRSVLVVVLNIPLALLGSVFALWLTGQTVNLMTLGGLALAVGILVDEATVEVENIHTQMRQTDSLARAVRRGNSETAAPRLLAMLCIVAVFIPSFFMEGAARALFVPLSLAVGFAMLTSYLLSSTLVPVLAVWLLKPPAGGLIGPYSRLVGGLLPWSWVLVPGYLLLAGLVIVLGGVSLGTAIFPTVDAGQFQIRLRAPTGTRIERTEELTVETLDAIKEFAGGPDKVDLSVAYIGIVPPAYPINSVYLWTRGPEEAVLRVALKPGGVRIEEFKERLRSEPPPRLKEWLRNRLVAEGVPADKAEQRARAVALSFEPADIVNEVMSFGSPTPVEVVVSGTKFAEDRAYAEKVRGRLEAIPELRDLQFQQALDYPTVDVQIDRQLLGRSGGTVEDVARSVLAGTSSSRFVVPNYWRDPANGVGYQVQVQVPIQQMNSAKKLELLPVEKKGGRLLLRDVAKVGEGTMPGELDRYNMRRLVSMTANIEGEDLGRVSSEITRALAELQKQDPPPRGVAVDVRGQVEPLWQVFGGLAVGLGLAVVAIYLLLAAYFQSLRLPLVVLSAVPAAVAGVVVALLLTRTTLNVQSFMGAIMAIGVGVANSILLVTFAQRARQQGMDARAAAAEGARHRLRPILMTSCAMLVGMLPLALGLWEGGEQTAPLGRAVIGGLLAATVATLTVVPSFFALVQGWGGGRSVSLDPDDPQSSHFDAEGAS